MMEEEGREIGDAIRSLKAALCIFLSVGDRVLWHFGIG